jgi:hypothetical protein
MHVTLYFGIKTTISLPAYTATPLREISPSEVLSTLRRH